MEALKENLHKRFLDRKIEGKSLDFEELWNKISKDEKLLKTILKMEETGG